MISNKNRKKFWPLRACLVGLAGLTFGGAATGQSSPSVIRAIHADNRAGVTTIDIALTGAMTPTLRDDGNSLVVTLPKAVAAPGLAQHLAGAGLISGISLVDVGWGTRVTLVLRSPSAAKIVSASDKMTVRVAIVPADRVALLASPRLVSAPSPRRTPEAGRTAQCNPVPRPVPAVMTHAAMILPRPAAVASRHVTLIAVPEMPTMPAEVQMPAAPMPSVPAEDIALPAPSVAALVPAVQAPHVRLYNVNAYQSDLAGVLNSLAQDSHVSIVMAGPVSSKVTMNLRQVPLEKAVDLLTKSAGLGYHRDGDVYVIGDAKGLEAAYPAPAPVVTQSVYRCLHVSALDVVTALQNTFDKDKLHVSVGATPSSPHLDDATASVGTGVQGNTMKNTGTTTGGANSHFLVISGEAGLVAQALDLAQKLDVRRAQVKIGVQITDINRSALKNLGLQWSFGNIGFHESQPAGIGFGSFTRDPLSVSATLSALENSGNAKLLAAPNMSILDGEQGFILIGDRIQYPKLTGYTQAQTPIYDVTEERVGIYLQVAVQMEDNGEITLTIYPQVSTVSGYLNVNGASYPQISTREQQTTIRVKDGQQIVVGGLIRDEEINNVQKVPILSQIPLFKELFTYRNTTRQQSEVVIVITPQILKD